MKWAFVFCAGVCCLVGLVLISGRSHCRSLTPGEMASLYGGDEYDDFATCDGSNSCTACVPPTCTVGVVNCVIMTAGNDGCANSQSTDSYCLSDTVWSDCEYK